MTDQADQARDLHARWQDRWEPITEPDPAYQVPDDQPSQYAETWLDLSATPAAEGEFWLATLAIYPPRAEPLSD